jgi:hypothetical protein
MKICIIGAGTASAIALLKIFEIVIDNRQPNIEVVCIHDPTIPVTHVGEAAGPVVLYLLYRVLNFCVPDEIKEFDGTLRWGNRYMWNDPFFVNHGSPGLHVNSEKFSFFVINKLAQQYSNFKIINDSVKSIEQTDKVVTVSGAISDYSFDYLIDCRGTPSKEELASDKYANPEFSGVNSVILYPDFKDYHEDFTSVYMHENGWMFGIPLTHRKAFGYLYNNTLTTEEEARSHFENLKNIDTSNLRKFSWDQYHRKEAIEGRILYLGNKLYFFEPTGAIPLHYYMLVVNQFFSTIINNKHEILEHHVNKVHRNAVNAVQDLIALNYVGNNSLDSEFWKNAKEKSFNRLKNSERFMTWAKDNAGKSVFSEYWKFDTRTMEQYVKGFKIDLTKFLN